MHPWAWGEGWKLLWALILNTRRVLKRKRFNPVCLYSILPWFSGKIVGQKTLVPCATSFCLGRYRITSFTQCFFAFVDFSRRCLTGRLNTTWLYREKVSLMEYGRILVASKDEDLICCAVGSLLCKLEFCASHIFLLNSQSSRITTEVHCCQVPGCERGFPVLQSLCLWPVICPRNAKCHPIRCWFLKACAIMASKVGVPPGRDRWPGASSPPSQTLSDAVITDHVRDAPFVVLMVACISPYYCTGLHGSVHDNIAVCIPGSRSVCRNSDTRRLLLV